MEQDHQPGVITGRLSILTERIFILGEHIETIHKAIYSLGSDYSPPVESAEGKKHDAGQPKEPKDFEGKLNLLIDKVNAINNEAGRVIDHFKSLMG